ncbi:MAG: cell division protein FtsW [Candidatus Solibacter usitatus]|nr:cell division protein FtsW [Candidatus Solibacter usitatus]
MPQQQKTDKKLFSTIVGLLAFGLVMVYSATSITSELNQTTHDGNYYLVRQFAWVVVSFIFMLYFKRKDYRKLESSVWALAPLAISMVLLIVVYFVDHEKHRWLRFGPVGFQPAEFARPAMAVFLAWFVSQRLHAINSRHTLVPAALVVAVLGFCVVVADLGTLMVLGLTVVGVFFVAGMSRRNIALACLVGLLAGGIAIVHKPYRLVRVLKHFDKEERWIPLIDPGGHLRARADKSATKDPSYHSTQALIAVASGGALGLGWMEGQQKLLFLPEVRNDYIYALIGEELGLWGATAVICAYLVILHRGFRLFMRAPDQFGRYLALGVTLMIVTQALINMTVVLDIVPSKGFTLPLVSYGGSSMLSTMISLGILLSVGDRSDMKES